MSEGMCTKRTAPTFHQVRSRHTLGQARRMPTGEAGTTLTQVCSRYTFRQARCNMSDGLCTGRAAPTF